MQKIANRLPDAFNDAAKVTKSHIPAVNTPTRIYVPEEHKEIDDDVPRQKRGRPIRSKDAAPRKKRGRNQEPSLLQSEQSALRKETTLKWLKPMKRSMIPRIQKSRSIIVMIFGIGMI